MPASAASPARLGRAAGIALTSCALALALVPERDDVAAQRAASRAAVERALPLLQHSAAVWSREMECFSCHHQGLGALAVGLARERGFELDEAAWGAELDVVRALSRERYVPLLVCDGVGVFGRALTLVALGAGERARDDVSDAVSHFVAARQTVSGAWASNEHRPPIEDSAVSATSWSVRALAAYGPEGRGDEMRARIAAARTWLSGVEPRDGEECCLQLLGLAWAGASDDELCARAAELAAQQRDDGGWAQLPTLESDAYATGQALVALQQTGALHGADPAWRRGTAFLRGTQAQDGSWHVVSRRRIEGQPQVDSQFPYGEDQFVSYAASAWALMALALDGAPPGRARALFGDPPGRAATDDTGPAHGVGALHRAAAFGSLEELAREIERGGDLDAPGPRGLSALTLAVHDERKVELLLEAGAAPDLGGEWGFTPLLLASLTSGGERSLALLLERGASVDCRGINGARPLLCATSRGDFASVARLLAGGARFDEQSLSTALVYAANCGDADSARALLALGAPLDRPSLQDHTPLSAAAIAGYEACLALFLEAGADPAIPGGEGLTPLAWAAATDPGHSRVVAALLAAGADPRDAGVEHTTPLALATQWGNQHHARLLRAALDERE
jgi:ankyrin repeat protein